MYVSVSTEGEWVDPVGRVHKQDVILSWSPGTYHSDRYSPPFSAPTKIGGCSCVYVYSCMVIEYMAWVPQLAPTVYSHIHTPLSIDQWKL